MLFGLVVRMRAHGLPPFGFQGASQNGFHCGLLGPAFLIGREAQIAIGDKVSVFRFQGRVRVHWSNQFRENVRQTERSSKCKVQKETAAIVAGLSMKRNSESSLAATRTTEHPEWCEGTRLRRRMS